MSCFDSVCRDLKTYQVSYIIDIDSPPCPHPMDSLFPFKHADFKDGELKNKFFVWETLNFVELN